MKPLLYGTNTQMEGLFIVGGYRLPESYVPIMTVYLEITPTVNVREGEKGKKNDSAKRGVEILSLPTSTASWSKSTEN